MKFNAWLEGKNPSLRNKGRDPALRDKKEEKPLDESLFHDPEEFQRHLRSTSDDKYGSYQSHYRGRTPFGASRKGSEETRDELQRMYTSEWGKAMGVIQHFLELKGAHEGTDKYIKALDEFLDRLRRLGMKG